MSKDKKQDKSESKMSTPNEKGITVLGRFIGMEAIGKSHYRVSLLHTVDGEISTKYVIGREQGMEIHRAFMELNIAIERHMKAFAPSLWRFNEELNPNAEEEKAKYEKTLSIKTF